MFHKNVVESDTFLDMPTSAQALYFHLGMYADDDGFVNGPRRIVRLIGANNDDLHLLIVKRFLLEFANGVVVVKHWRIANSLKNDRAKMPQYPELAAMIYIKENRSYTDHPVAGAVSLLEYKQQYLESKRNPDGFPTERKGTEGNRTEGNRAEAEADGIQPGMYVSAQFSTTEELAQAKEDRKLKLFGGELGKNVVFLSDDQISDLLNKLGIDAFDYYVDKLASYILKTGAKPKNHHATILTWWLEDSAV